MLNLTGLIAGYPDSGRVLEGVELSLAEGECVGLMGRNGMGKTTLLRTIMGHLRPEAGRVRFAGEDITAWPPFAVSNRAIAYVPQGREIFNDFSVEENLLLGLIGKKLRPVIVPDSVFQHFPVLAERRRQTAGTLSGGEQQQLAVARAIVSRPRLLLLDEPSEGIQPSIVQSLGATVATIAREQKMSVVLVEQNLDLVLALTTRCLFMENGRIVDQMDTASLRTDKALLDRYLAI
jgi:urea transport system ATP-binding protein